MVQNLHYDKSVDHLLSANVREQNVQDNTPKQLNVLICNAKKRRKMLHL